MPVHISHDEANAIAAYEPIDSEFRKQAYKKWQGAQTGTGKHNLRKRRFEPDAGILTQTATGTRRIEDLESSFDYYPLDKVESSRQACSFNPGKKNGRISELSILQRASLRLRQTFRNH